MVGQILYHQVTLFIYNYTLLRVLQLAEKHVHARTKYITHTCACWHTRPSVHDITCMNFPAIFEALLPPHNRNARNMISAPENKCRLHCGRQLQFLNENGGWASVRDLRDSPHWSRLMPAPHVPFISLADLHLHISPALAPPPPLTRHSAFHLLINLAKDIA